MVNGGWWMVDGGWRFAIRRLCRSRSVSQRGFSETRRDKTRQDKTMDGGAIVDLYLQAITRVDREVYLQLCFKVRS